MVSQSDAKICLITGGTRGIGAALARTLASRGYELCLNFKNDARSAKKLKDELSIPGRRTEVYQADISIKDDVQCMMERIRVDFGRLDVLVHNASAPIVPKRALMLDWVNDVVP